MLRLLSYGPNFPSQPSASHHAGSFDRDDTAKGSPIRATSRAVNVLKSIQEKY